MKEIHKYLSLITILLLYSCFSVAQVCYYSCGYTTDNATSQYPANTIIGNYNSLFATVNTCIYGGEYQIYQVEQGAYYEWSYWSTDGANVNGDLMALSLYDIFANELEYNIFCSNSETKLVWAATFTGQVVLLNNNVSSDALGNLFCDTNQTCHTLRWRQLPQPFNSTLVPYNGNNTVIIDCSNQTNLYDYSGNGYYLDNLDGYTVLSNNGSGSISILGNYSTELDYDFIKIYAGVGITGSLLATYSGEGTINYVGMPGQSLTVHFSSDESIVSYGFALNITYLSTTPSAPTSITGNSTACSGSTTTLSVNGTLSGGASWIWYRNSCGGTYVGTGSSITVNPTSTTTYYVRAEGSCNNVSSCVSKTITITTSPSISISVANSAVCSGSSTNLSASVTNGTSGCTIQWQRSTTGTSNWTNVGTNTTTYTTGALTTPYYYRAIYTCTTCSSPATSNTLQITVNPIPNPPALSSATYCQGSTATVLNANDSNISNETFSWNTGATAAAITPSTNTAGTTTYTVTVTKSGCSATRSATITVNPIPNPPALSSATYCQGSTATVLNANDSNISNETFSWNTGATAAAITPSTNTAGTTTYTVTVTKSGCSATRSATITVNPIPNPPALSSATYCQGSTATVLNANDSNISNETFSWNTGATAAAITPSTNTAGTTTYTVTVTKSGCSATRSATITVNPIPNPPALSSATYCQGSTATVLNANDSNISNETFSWNTGATVSSITPSTNTTGTTTYTVTVTKSGCSATRSATITVNPTPTISAASSNCNTGTGTVTITAFGGSGLIYKLGNTTQSNNTFNNLSNGNYTVTVTNSNDCSTTTNVTVNCSNCPTASLINNGTACTGQNVTLTAQPNLYTGITVNNYQWSNGASNSATMFVTNTGTYTVTISYSNGCIATATTAVVINPTPTPTISSSPTNGTICSGSSVTLSVNSGYNSYTWSNGGGTASTATYTNLSSTTTYTVTVTNNSGCTGTATKTITIIPSPTVAPILGNANVCAGTSTTYTNSTSGGIWSNNNTTTGSISPSGVFTATATGNATIGYQVSVGGCTTNVTKNITVVPNPTATISSPNAVCTNQSVTLIASGGSSYQWNSDLGTSPTITQTPIATTTYTVTVTNANGCTATTSKTITVMPLPTVNPISGATNICVGSSVNLSNTTLGGIWASNNESIATISTNGVVQGVNSGSTLISYTVTVGGCANSTTATITVNASPTAAINATGTGVCLGENITLTASGVGSYQWSENWGTTQSITVNPAITTTYTVTITATNNCTATASKSIMIYNLPNAEITTNGSTVFCQGDNPTLTASGGTTYMWSSGQTTSTYIPTNSNTYTVTVTNSFGCSQTASIDIIAIPLPNNTIAISENQDPQNNDTYVCKGNNVNLVVVNSPTANYLWSTNTTTNLLNMQPNNDDIYTVTITDLGCTVTNSVTIIVSDKPVINIEGDLEVCEGANTTITASGGSNYQWSNSISNTSATITLYNAGVYTVTVTSDNGCSSSHSLNITQLPVPSANFSVLQNGLRGIIVGNNSTNYTHVFWDFGDGSYSQENSVFHTYQNDGNYTISLIASNSESCYDTITQNISIPNIIYNPKLSLYPNPNDGFFTLNFVADCDCFLIIDIFDLVGHFVSREIKEVTVGLNQLDFNQSQLPQGVYAIGISKNDKNEYIQQFDTGLFSKTKLKYNLWSKLVKY